MLKLRRIARQRLGIAQHETDRTRQPPVEAALVSTTVAATLVCRANRLVHCDTAQRRASLALGLTCDS